MIPVNLKTRTMSSDDFEKYRGLLGGVTPRNAKEVADKIAELQAGKSSVPPTGKTRRTNEDD